MGKKEGKINLGSAEGRMVIVCPRRNCDRTFSTKKDSGLDTIPKHADKRLDSGDCLGGGHEVSVQTPESVTQW